VHHGAHPLSPQVFLGLLTLLIPFFHPIDYILNPPKLTFRCFLLQLGYLFLTQTTTLTGMPAMTMAEHFS
jgi:hypothetical protein